MPLTVGPGSIAVALTLGSNLHEETHLQLIFSALTAVIGILLIGLSIFLCYWLSEQLQRFLGPTGTSVLIRLSAFIVVCIGIQIMFNGLEDFYRVLKSVPRQTNLEMGNTGKNACAMITANFHSTFLIIRRLVLSQPSFRG
jgi:multiple antibiotic resistance protein